MFAERITGIVLMGAALVLGIAMLFVPMGEAWVQENGVRTTNEFHFFTKAVETAPAATPEAPTSTSTWYYIDDGLSSSGGITYLQAMGPIAAVGLLLVAAGLVLTAVPRTSPTRAGGFLALPGAVLLFVAVVLSVVGIPMHAADQVARSAQVDWHAAGSSLAILTVFLSVLASGMGITRVQAGSVTEPEEDWSPLGAQAGGPMHADDSWAGHDESPWEDDAFSSPAQAASQYLKCPDCSTIVEAEPDTIPICPDCGFGEESSPEGPAAPTGHGTAA